LALTDFEAGRRERETRSERRIALILGTAFLLSAVGQLVVRKLPEAPLRPPLGLTATALGLGAGSLLIWAWLGTRPAYAASRKYAIGVFHLAGFLSMALASRALDEPVLSLIVPVPMFALLVALSGLRFDARHVVWMGAGGIVSHLVLIASGPPLRARLPAAALGVLLLAAVTAAVSEAVRNLVALHGESVTKERLGRFFAPEIASRVEQAPELALGAVDREVTVLFSDISGFTRMSSGMTPGEVVALLNDYFPGMVEIVFRHGGTLEKYIGDALLAVWGAPVAMPDHADRALRAAVEMQVAVRELDARWAVEGRAPIDVHIGLNSGHVAAGHVGTDQYIQYACIGDTTNVSSRVCSAAEAREIVVSAATRSALTLAEFELEAMPPLRAKGKDAPLEVYRVIWSPGSATGRERVGG
jgi:class 3 adenylate cyclase